MSIAGSLWVASAVGRIDVAEALRDRSVDLPGSQASAWPALAFRLAVPSGGHVGYMDTTAVLPGYTELIELGGAFDEVFGRFHRASVGWDGKDPIRSFI